MTKSYPGAVDETSRDRLEIIAEERWRIAEISRIVSSTLNLDDVFAAFAEQANVLIPFDRLAISVLSDDKTELVDRFVSGIEFEGSAPGAQLPIKYGEFYEHIFVQKRQLLVTGPDLEELVDFSSSEQIPLNIGLKSLLVTPLVWQGSVIGAINFRAFDPQAFTAHRVELAAQIASHIAGAIATTNGYAALEREATERMHLAEIGRILSSSLEMDGVYPAAVEHAHQMIQFDRLDIAALSEDETELVSQFVDGQYADDTAVGTRFPIPRGETENAVYQKVFVQQLQFRIAGEEYRGLAQQSPGETARISAGIRSLLIVPLVWQGSVTGSMAFRSVEPEAFSEHEAEQIRQISILFAGALATWRQSAILRREIDQRGHLSEIGRIVSSSLSLDEVFSAFSEHARYLVPAERLSLWMFSKISSEATSQFTDGIKVIDSQEDQEHPSIAKEVFEQVVVRKLHFVARGKDYEEFKKNKPDEESRFSVGLRSLLITPLIWQDEIIGGLGFRSFDPDAFNDREVELALQVSSQIAGAVSAINQYSLIEKESAERQILADQQSRMAEIGRIVSSSLKIDEALTAFVEQARALVPFDRIAITVVNDDLTEATDVLVDGIGLEISEPGVPVKLPPHTALHDAVALGSRYVLMENGEDYVAYAQRTPAEKARYEAGLNSLLIVPLMWNGRCIGTLNLRSVLTHAYGSEEIDMANRIGAQIAGAIATSNQYLALTKESSERQRLADEQSLIAEIGRIVSSTLDLKDVFSAFVERTKALVPFDRIVITTVNEELTEATDIFVDGFGVDHEIGSDPVPISTDILPYEAIVNKTEIVMNGDEYAAYSNDSPIEQARRYIGLNSCLFMPLVWQGRCIGSLNLRSVDPQAYGPREVDLVKQIAAQISGAITTADQFSSLAKESAERQRLADQQSTIAEIGRIVSSTLDLDDVLSGFVEQARSLVPFDRIVVSVLNNDMTSVTDALVDGAEVDADAGAGKSSYLIADNPALLDTINNQKIFVANGEAYLAFADRLPTEQKRCKVGLNSLMIVPLIWQGNALGSLNLRSRDPQAYGPREIDLAGQIAAQISGAIIAANQYSRIKESEENYRDLVEGGRILVWRIDTEGRYSYVNSAWEQTLGYTAEEMIGTSVFDYVKKEYLPKGQERLTTISSGETMVGLETVLRSKNGNDVNLLYSAFPMLDSEGNVTATRGYGIDVTAEHVAREHIRIQALALEAAGDGVVIVGTDQKIEYVNDAFVNDTGYSKEELIGVMIPAIPSPGNTSELFTEMWDTVKLGETWRAVHQSLRKDGTKYHVDSLLTPVFGADGSITRYIGIRRDITDRVQADLDRQARQELDAQNLQLLEISRQREQFFSTVSHELRTPLTSVLAFADILTRNRNGNLSALQLEQLDVIKRNSRNLNDLIEDMLDFSRLSAEKLNLTSTEFEVHSLVDSVVESLQPTATQNHQTLKISAHRSQVWVNADFGRMTQVLSNLVANSCKYSPPGTSITVAILASEGEVELIVSDEGYGISAEDLSHIFEPFFRSSNKDIRNKAGTGLGLTISKTLVELHGGQIKATSTAGAGTSFNVTLPCANNQPGLSAENSASSF